MTAPIRIFLGSDIWNRAAERALIHSIRSRTSAEVSFTIMSRFGSDPTWKGWAHTEKWPTCFSCFRWAIPAACAGNGDAYAIYLDSDMIVLGDIAELLRAGVEAIAGMQGLGAIATTPERESSVMVMDCAAFKAWPWFSLESLKADAKNTAMYYKILRERNRVAFIPQDWNCLDGDGYDPALTKLLHFTELTTQPWHPAPHRFTYKPHPRADLAALWRREYEASFEGTSDHTAEGAMR